jgi:K+-sensing histidine kinase KdpD
VAEEVARRIAMALENARLYQQARRAIRTRNDLLAVVSHDLRNPLSTILVASALLMQTLPAGESGAQDRNKAEIIRAAAQRMLRLIGDLLDVAAIEAGRLSMTMQRQAAVALVHDGVAMEQMLATQKQYAFCGPHPVFEPLRRLETRAGGIDGREHTHLARPRGALA